jgi:hypothetical protein
MCHSEGSTSELGFPAALLLMPGVASADTDEVVVTSVFDDGHACGTTNEKISAGRHLVRVEGRSPSTVISSVSVSPAADVSPSSDHPIGGVAFTLWRMALI